MNRNNCWSEVIFSWWMSVHRENKNCRPTSLVNVLLCVSPFCAYRMSFWLIFFKIKLFYKRQMYFPSVFKVIIFNSAHAASARSMFDDWNQLRSRVHKLSRWRTKRIKKCLQQTVFLARHFLEKKYNSMSVKHSFKKNMFDWIKWHRVELFIWCE